MNDYRTDKTIIAEAANYAISERNSGRQAVFTREVVGLSANFRQRRLFELALLREEVRLDGGQDSDFYRHVDARMGDYLAT